MGTSAGVDITQDEDASVGFWIQLPVKWTSAKKEELTAHYHTAIGLEFKSILRKAKQIQNAIVLLVEAFVYQQRTDLSTYGQQEDPLTYKPI